jgi:hypothetical protein
VTFSNIIIAECYEAGGGWSGVGGAFVRSAAGRTGLVTVTAEHPSLGSATARLTVTPALGRTFL